jgi:hypothetical protein
VLFPARYFQPELWNPGVLGEVAGPQLLLKSEGASAIVSLHLPAMVHYLGGPRCDLDFLHAIQAEKMRSAVLVTLTAHACEKFAAEICKRLRGASPESSIAYPPTIVLVLSAHIFSPALMHT